MIHPTAGAKVRIHSSASILPSGSETILRCEASGDQPLTVYWRRSDQLANQPDRLIQLASGVSSSAQFLDLNISRVEAEDAGLYICYAINPYGSDVSEIRLIVQGIFRNSGIEFFFFFC